MEGTVLVVNAGSSSIKFGLWPVADPNGSASVKGEVTRIGQIPRLTARDGSDVDVADELWDKADGDYDALFRHLTDWIDKRQDGRPLAAAGHRVVHGGTRFTAPVRIDHTVLGELEKLVPLAPLHQPHNLAAIRALRTAHPELVQVACFDTAFHAGHADVASRFALPRTLHDAGIRRYGFHGLSYEYIARALPALAPEVAHGRVVVAHLGSGASLCAMRDGVSVDTTMGFTALDGLMMGTRCGALDPGVMLFLMGQGMGQESLQHLLYHESGLLGVSGGIGNDMRDLLGSDRPAAAQAVDLFVYRAIREIGAMAACMGGLDGLVFTAGIGEHASMIRERICRGCGWLGVDLDSAANTRDESRITKPDSRASAWVIPTDEERMIASHTVETLMTAQLSSKELLHA